MANVEGVVRAAKNIDPRHADDDAIVQVLGTRIALRLAPVGVSLRAFDSATDGDSACHERGLGEAAAESNGAEAGI